MKLLLTSNGLCNDSIRNALREMVGKPTSDANIVFVPTGSWPVRGNKGWLVDDMRRAYDMGWKNFEILDIATSSTWPKDRWLPVFADADVIMFCGGHSEYLSYWLEQSELLTELPTLLAQNKVYIGISAGSMVATKSLATSSAALRTYADMPDSQTKQTPPGQGGDKTLGLTDFLFRPHLNSSSFPLVRLDFMQQFAATNGEQIYLVDDETAVRVVDGKVDVVSEGEWHLLH